MTKLAVAFLFSLAAGPLAAQTTAGDQASVTAVVDRFHAALAGGDQATNLQLLADDAVLLEAGSVETKAQYGANHLPADIEFEKGTSTKRSAIRVVVLGNAAWASSTSETTGTFQGRPIDSIGGELMVLSRETAGWRIRAIHWSGRARPRPQ